MPAYFRVSDGAQVQAGEALAAGALRPGYRQLVADGEAVTFSTMMMDRQGGLANGGAPMLTDAQQAFADSAHGLHHLALARRAHEQREAHKGSLARPWTDAMQAGAIRDGAQALERRTVVDPGELAIATAIRDTAYAMRKQATSTAWKR